MQTGIAFVSIKARESGATIYFAASKYDQGDDVEANTVTLLAAEAIKETAEIAVTTLAERQ